ncbi:exoribonuclease II [Buchnera aphidicola (Hormaphis cornu)]|nr:exoribonuclease II [Buchnera aphidicola (Hormaphis cornu)]
MLYNNPILLELKKNLQSQTLKIEGIIKNTTRGFGFLETNTNKTYFIPVQYMKKVMHKDRVLARIKIKNCREFAEPYKLLEPFLKKFIGQIQIQRNKTFIVPEDPLFNHLNIFVLDKNIQDSIHPGDWILAKLVKHKLQNKCNFFYANILQLITRSYDPFALWLTTLLRYNLPHNEPNIEGLQLVLNSNEKRCNLTKLDFISIDNANTKDIDDVLFIDKNKNNDFVLTIAIADPTAYILDGSTLDVHALNRAFTLYLPGFNIPMLPRKLAEDLCSLKPNLRRSALVCTVNISQDGILIDDSAHFCIAWIRSIAKLSYENVSNWLENIGTWKPQNKKIANQLLLLRSLYKKRFKWRQEHTLIFKNKLEYRFQFNDSGKVIDIISESRRIAHHIIEEAMIVANICAANLLSKKLGFGIYNIHSGFETRQAANKAVMLLARYGIYFKEDEIISLPGFFKLKKILDKLNDSYVNSRIKHFQSYSTLSIKPKPHFGLGVKCYATWTSPIRKYSDIINHRLIKSIILKKEASKPKNDILSRINYCKQKNKKAERDLLEKLYIDFFADNNNKKHLLKSEIIKITYSGIKVRLINTGAIAFIPAYLVHINKSQLIFNQENGIVYLDKEPIYRLSDILTVKVIEVKKNQRQIIVRPY